MKTLFTRICILLAVLAGSQAFAQQPGTISSFTKISGANLQINDPLQWILMGQGMVQINDIDGDNIPDMAAGIRFYGGSGYVYIFRMNANGTVKRYNRIGPGEGGFPGDGWGTGAFGISIGNLGDRDSNGVDDLIVGSGLGISAYVLHLDTGGQVISWANVARDYNGYTEPIASQSRLGITVASIGDINNDGVVDVAIGDDAEDSEKGAVKILFLNTAGTVDSMKSIESGIANFATIAPFSNFGISITGIGDLDADGTEDMMVGAYDTYDQRGKVYTIFLNSDGSVKNYTTITAGVDIADTTSSYSSSFVGLSAIGDIDGDSVIDVALGSPGQENDNGITPGRVFILFMNSDGTVKAYTIVDGDHGGWTSPLEHGDGFGSAIIPIGDFNGDGMKDIAVSATTDDDADPTNVQRNSGAIYYLYLYGVMVTTSTGDKITNKTQSYFVYPNPASDHLIIKPRNSQDKIATATLIDATGRIFRELKSEGQQLQINVSELPSGNYFIQVKGNGKAETVRFTKQ